MPTLTTPRTRAIVDNTLNDLMAMTDLEALAAVEDLRRALDNHAARLRQDLIEQGAAALF